jgi:GT2 family glycosyltransferase
MNKVCVIIVTYNAEQWLDTCLKPFIDKPNDITVVVVDNLSSDKTVDIINQKYKFVKLFQTGENLGFGRANNVGIQWAYDNGFEHMFLLNQDAYIDIKSLYKLCDLQKQNPQYWCLSPMHYIAPNKLERNFVHYIEQSGLSEIIKNPINDTYDIKTTAAALWLLSRQCISIVGAFNPSFLHYAEDSNYVQRIFYHGGKMGLAPKITAYHYRGESAAKKSHFTIIKGTWRAIVYDLSDPNIKNNKMRIKWELRLIQRMLLSCISFNFKRSSVYLQLLKRLHNEHDEIYKNKIISCDTGAFIKK